LQSHPEFSGDAQHNRKTQGGIGSDVALAVDDLINFLVRNAPVQGQPVLAE